MYCKCDKCSRKKYFDEYFHKTFNHDDETGTLINIDEYMKLVKGIKYESYELAKSVKLHKNSELKLADYYASFEDKEINNNYFNLIPPGKLCSKRTAAEMVELYAMVLCRDVSFCCYDHSSRIKRVLNHLNEKNVIKYLPDKFLECSKFTSSTIFRGFNDGELYGPYISQLLLLNIPMGAHIVEQKYYVHPKKDDALRNDITIEWGKNSEEMIKIQNGELSKIPSNPKNDEMVHRYIFNGRTLGEVVHNDPVYQIYHNAALILSKMGAMANDGFKSMYNCGKFINGDGLASLLTSISGCSIIALKHAWYWKWKVYRRLRPEVTSLWIDNVINCRVNNEESYNLSSTILNSDILNDIEKYNSMWGCKYKSSYTLPLQYKEGSPTHPSYPAGHAVVAGALCTILKIYFDDTVKWKDLKAIKDEDNVLIPDNINDFVTPTHDGKKLRKYKGDNLSEITVGNEINKLASNVALGRDWAGVHYRSDGTQGILLGELVAIDYMKDVLRSWKPKEIYKNITFTRFDGSRYKISI